MRGDEHDEDTAVCELEPSAPRREAGWQNGCGVLPRSEPRAPEVMRMSPAGAGSLVIFDCDGVLVDFEVVAARVLARELAAIGFPLNAEECIARYTGISMRSVIERVEAEWGQRVTVDFIERVRARDADAFRAELRAVPGVREVLPILAHQKCVASSGSLDKMRLTLTLTWLCRSLRLDISSPRRWSRTASRLPIFSFSPRSEWASCRNAASSSRICAGVRAAIAACMRVLGFVGGSHCAPGYEAMLRDAGAPRVFSDMRELPALVEGEAVT